jgi:hypothetical protein
MMNDYISRLPRISGGIEGEIQGSREMELTIAMREVNIQDDMLKTLAKTTSS